MIHLNHRGEHCEAAEATQQGLGGRHADNQPLLG